MAINRGPWNALIDDDGSNTVGTVWNKDKIKTVILDPVDAAIAPTYGTFTPIDASGAGLVMAYTDGKYSKIDRVVCIWLQVVYPTTTNGVNASIGGLPFPVRCAGAATQGYGPGFVWYVTTGGTTMTPGTVATFANVPNAQLSGANLIVNATYLTD